MATADLLVELMFFWIAQRENCAKQLKKLADELETLREKCNAAECVGSSVSVVGAASLIGAGVATFFTAGAAAPLLALAGGLYGVVGVAVSVTTKIIEHFSSSDTLKDAEKIEKKNNEIAAKIQNLFEQLKVEVKRMYPSADPDQVDRHVMTSFMGAVARRHSPSFQIDFSQHKSFYDTGLGIRQISIINAAMKAGLTIGCLGIFTVFSLKTSGKQTKFLFGAATKRLVKEVSSIGLKTAIKGGAMVVGGAVGMGFALHEAIRKWTDQIENNHETEASQSMRDTADDNLKNCRKVTDQFDDIRTVLEEWARRQPEEEESDSEEETEEKESKVTLNVYLTYRPPPGTIRLGLLNVHSMRKKTGQISELITQNNLDVFLTTETWLTDDTAVTVLSEASPEGFSFHYQVRTDGRRGGGVANQFSERLQGEQIHFNHLNITTFEFVVTALQRNDQPLVIINLYHPRRPRTAEQFCRFLKEFQSLLDEVKKNYSSFIVTGDFNIRPKKGERCYTDEFYSLLQVNDLTQHVKEPTHRGGNTLDLVLTSNVEVSGLIVRDDGISDHYTVYFNAKPKHTREKTEEI